MSKIVLTDYPKVRHIDANYRGMETEELLKLLDTMFHLMMPCWTVGEVVGGWSIRCDPEGVRKELEFRKVEVSKSGCNCTKGEKQ